MNEQKVELNQESIQICPVCGKKGVVVWYDVITTKLFCLECGGFWIEGEDIKEDPREYVDWKIRELDKKVQKIVEKAISDVAKNCPITPWKLSESTIIVGEEKEDTYGKYIDEKNKQLDKEVEGIVEGAISKVIMASLASGVPCDPDTSDGINYIESCLDKMKKEMEESEDI
jgi:hypothetical protein